MFSLKRSRWPPIFITFLTSLTHHLSIVNFVLTSLSWKVVEAWSKTWKQFRRMFTRESHNSRDSSILIGYLGEIFSVELWILKARLCARDIALERQQSNNPITIRNDDFLIMFSKSLSLSTKAKTSTSFSLLWGEVKLLERSMKSLALASTRKRQDHNLDKK